MMSRKMKNDFFHYELWTLLGKCTRCPPKGELGVIVRTSEFAVESKKKTLVQLHGKIKGGVTTNKNPGMSPPVLEWGLLGPEVQESVISHFIHAAISN